MRIGAGLVTLACPGAARAEIAAQTTAIMSEEVETAEDLKQALGDARRDVICLGPGMGVDTRAAGLLEAALQVAPPPGHGTYLGQGRRLVLDADALTLLAQREAPFEGLGEHVVLTPHMGEFARLFPDIAERLSGPKRPAIGYQDDDPHAKLARFAQIEAYRAALQSQNGPAYSKLDAAREAAARCGAVVLLKGADTVVAEPGGRAWVHSAARQRTAPWLATAGAGDVLAGFIAGLIARKHMPHEAAVFGAQLHVDCALEFGPGLIAEDLPEVLPHVLRAHFDQA
ncbi:ADP-dependent NAD(P)H-hydrate dehydratase [Roseobacteraceae bacterium S113]